MISFWMNKYKIFFSRWIVIHCQEQWDIKISSSTLKSNVDSKMRFSFFDVLWWKIYYLLYLVLWIKYSWMFIEVIRFSRILKKPQNIQPLGFDFCIYFRPLSQVLYFNVYVLRFAPILIESRWTCVPKTFFRCFKNNWRL